MSFEALGAKWTDGKIELSDLDATTPIHRISTFDGNDFLGSVLESNINMLRRSVGMPILRDHLQQTGQLELIEGRPFATKQAYSAAITNPEVQTRINQAMLEHARIIDRAQSTLR